MISPLEHVVRVGAYDGVSETTLTAEYIYLLPVLIRDPLYLKRIAYQAQWADANGDVLRFGIYQSISGTGNSSAMPTGTSGSNWRLMGQQLVGTAGSWLAASPTPLYVDLPREMNLIPKRGSGWAIGIKASGGGAILSGVDQLIPGHISHAAMAADSAMPQNLSAILNSSGSSPSLVLMSFDGARAVYGSIPSRTVVG